MLKSGESTLALPSRQEVRDVAAAWEAFMAGETRGTEKLRPVIRESWERCQRLAIDPHLPCIPLILTAEDLEALQERVDLVEVATPLLETVTQAWEHERFMLGVSDRHGRILHTTGHPAVLEFALKINAITGGSLAEEHVGTAIANVVLSQGHADYVMWYEHYCKTFHPWAAIGAPLFHPLTHELIGVVGAAGDELAHPRALEIIRRIAERIEQLLHHEELVRRVALLDAYHQFVLQHPHDIVLAVDGRGHICGASPSITGLLGEPAQVLNQSLLRLPDWQAEGFHHPTQQQDLRPYSVRLTRSSEGTILNATAIPIAGERQSVGTLVVVPHSHGGRQHKEPASSLWRATYTFKDLVGIAPSFLACLTLARQAVQSDFPVLLLGESGTGKELLAQAIHVASLRGQGPFVAVNCGALSDELLAAELFGYVEGAFTGAVKGGKKGKLELAHGGTLLLDEVETMSAKMQVSLLRVLEEKQVVRVGSERPVAVDVRVMAASNEDLKTAVSQKKFRADLYHRLCIFPIPLPPLRERREDIPLLVSHLLNQLGFPHLRLTAEAISLLQQYSWPGNVRELRNVLVRAAHKAQGTAILPEALPAEIVAAATTSRSIGSLQSTEREMIVRALAASRNPAEAAAQLGIHRTTLYRKLKKYGFSYMREP